MADLKIYFNVSTKKQTKVFLFLTLLFGNFAYICGVLNVGEPRFVRYAEFQIYNRLFGRECAQGGAPDFSSIAYVRFVACGCFLFSIFCSGGFGRWHVFWEYV